jgi:hypothetical protein
MSNRRVVVGLGLGLFAAAFLAPMSRAQDEPSESKGTNQGNYNIQQSVEFGYRLNEVKGNQDTYNTFVNLGSGLRLFDYTLNMRSINHQGILFDDLNFSNFGYGGDPNDVSRLRIDKNKWYDFQLMFRRDKNFWDYNLWANPLNPASPNPVGSATSGCILSPPTAAHPGLPGYCSTPSMPQANSLHALDQTRRMQDYDLTILPQSRVRFRLGFSHYRDEGGAFFTTDSGGMPDFPGNNSYSTNAYHAGVDVRILPRTIFSYDQFLNYFKQDNSYLESPTATPGLYGYQLANGTPVDFGVVWSTQTPAEALPCAAPIAVATTTPPTANPSCNGFLSYSQVYSTRNYMPTEQARVQSNYFQKFEMTASAGYSRSDNFVPNFNEVLDGLVTRSATRESTTGGPADTSRVSVNADWSGVYAVTDKLRIEDFYRYDNWRIPGMWATFETNLFGAAGSGQLGLAQPLSVFNQVSSSTAGLFAALCPVAPYNQVNCPLHTTSSGADVTNEITSQFLGQSLQSNTFQVQYDFTRRISARVGYLFLDRNISQFSATWDTGETYFPGGTGATAANDYFAARGDCALVAAALPSSCIKNADGSITEGSPTNLAAEAGNDTTRAITTIHEQAGTFGITARPIDQLTLNGDVELGYNDASFTRVDPRQMQSYKVHATYKPKMWAVIDAAVEIHENRDDVITVSNLEHDRSYSFNTTLMPSSSLSVSFGYNYWDVYNQADICFNYSITYTNPAPPPSTLPVSVTPPGVATTACTITGASVGAAGLETLSTYSSTDHFAHAEVTWNLFKRITTSLGYSGSFVRGSSTSLNPLNPSGTLDYNYMLPFGSVKVDIYRGLSYKMGWNYYGFNQEGNTTPFGLAPIPSQDFNGSNLTFSFRYAF